MFGDRRKHKRVPISRAAKFVSDAGELPHDCIITDLSEDGARLFSETAAIPDRFHLLISGETSTRQECRVVWRLGGEIGVAFVSHEQDQERARTVKELQVEARNLLRQQAD